MNRNIYAKIRAYGAAFKFAYRDYSRYLKHFNYLKRRATLEKFKAELVMNAHVIEKGLTMPDVRFGFGQSQIHTLINIMHEFMNCGYSKGEFELQESAKILNEYVAFHARNSHPVDPSILAEIDSISNRTGTFEGAVQLSYTLDSYFCDIHKPFKIFAISRHSIRNYSDEEIPDTVFEECAFVAQNSPSSCNRQPVKLYVIKDKPMILEALSLQNGNRGFGHLATALLIVTSDLSCFQSFPERHEPALNAGMFSMGLLYALHQEKVGACPLNWCVNEKNDQKLRKLAGIPDSEQVHLLISCGYPPNTFQVSASSRVEISEVLSFVRTEEHG